MFWIGGRLWEVVAHEGSTVTVNDLFTGFHCTVELILLQI